jgi:penicillin-binding protein 1C
MQNVSGVTGAAPVWAEVMAWLQRNAPQETPEPPGDVIAREVIFPNEIEPPHIEWFLRGSEPQPAARQLVREQGRILTPTDGVILALDPDIPPARQRVIFAAAHTPLALRWWLDGVAIGAASAPVFWEPTPGQHVLTLADERGAIVDRIAFSVRGGKQDLH